MKKKYFFLYLPAIMIACCCFSQPSHAQLLKRIRDKVKQTASDHVVNDAGNATDNAIDKAEHPNVGNNSNNNSSNNNNSSSDNNNTAQTSVDNNIAANNNVADATVVPTVQTYKNYDFVPGDSIIFQSDITNEQIGEIPSQFTLYHGQIDVQMEDSQKVMHFAPGPRDEFSPRMSTTNYMPDQFTIEFDFKNEKAGIEHVAIGFDPSYYGGGSSGILPEILFDYNNSTWSLGDVDYPATLHINYNYPMQWHHVAIAVNKNQGKIYIDQYRVQNVNNLTGKANMVYFLVDGYENSWIKNIRIAAGGIDIYKKITTNAKIIMHGIQFDVDKATLKPESMGSINQIYNLMQKDPSLKFEIDGHTDNTGDAAHNLTLSQQRADAVKTQLVSMGIDASRLTTKGFGDTKPIGDNNTPDGRANNRRVEFVKM